MPCSRVTRSKSHSKPSQKRAAASPSIPTVHVLRSGGKKEKTLELENKQNGEIETFKAGDW